jgi:hypothetical protein
MLRMWSLPLGGRGWTGRQSAGPKALRDTGRGARRRARDDDAEGAVCGKGSPKTRREEEMRGV